MRTEQDVDERFPGDIAEHVMEVIRDDGIYRHLRFKKPTTTNMHFDILTWPGCLCYTGDMGTFVFQRLRDMFEFFRRGDSKYPIDYRYWAEKAIAVDKGDGIKRYSQELFEEAVNERVAAAVEDMEPERAQELRDEVYDSVLSYGDCEYTALTAVCDFEHNGFQFYDWENDCKDYSYRFVWCCRAIEWAIQRYDAHCADKEG